MFCGGGLDLKAVFLLWVKAKYPYSDKPREKQASMNLLRRRIL